MWVRHTLSSAPDAPFIFSAIFFKSIPRIKFIFLECIFKISQRDWKTRKIQGWQKKYLWDAPTRLENQKRKSQQFSLMIPTYQILSALPAYNLLNVERTEKIGNNEIRGFTHAPSKWHTSSLGFGNSIFLSIRPGLSRAWSRISIRFVAIKTWMKQLRCEDTTTFF